MGGRDTEEAAADHLTPSTCRIEGEVCGEIDFGHISVR